MVLNILVLALGVVCFVFGVLNIRRMADKSAQSKAVAIASDFFVAGWNICFALFKLLG